MTALSAYQAAFTAHLRDPAQHPRPAGTLDKRMAVYREIVFQNFAASVSACFPVLRSVLGVRVFKRVLRDCFRDGSFQSPLFQDIPAAFVAYLQSRTPSVAPPASALDGVVTAPVLTAPLASSLPAYAAQLAHYEWLELALSRQVTAASMGDPAPRIDTPAALASHVLALTEAHALAEYDFPVHTISRRHHAPPPTPTQLLVYRNADHHVRFIVLNALTALLLAQIKAHPTWTVTAHLEQLALLLPGIPKDTLLQGGLETLFKLYLQQAVCCVHTL